MWCQGEYPIVRISKRRLRQLDSEFDGEEIRGHEQNPDPHAVKMESKENVIPLFSQKCALNQDIGVFTERELKEAP